MITNSSNIKK